MDEKHTESDESKVINCGIPRFPPYAPTAPILDNNDELPYPVSVVLNRNPPPYSCSSLMSNSQHTEPLLVQSSEKENERAQQLRRNRTDAMFKVALFTGITAVFMLAGGIWCVHDLKPYCPYFSAIWTSSVFLVNAFIGIAAAKRCTVNLFVAYLVFSLISLMLCAISATISARNWFLVGTYKHPKLDRNQGFCLLGEYDATRLRYILSHMNRYDFKQCLFQHKIGISINSIQFVVAIIEAILNFLSSVLCCKQLCTKWCGG